MVRLVISDNEGTTTVVPLVRDEITIGRKEGNTIRLTERNISRQHVQLVRHNGAYKLRDLDSYNGVLINGRRVQGESDLSTGDQVQIGDYTILVEEEAQKSLPPPPQVAQLERPTTPARLVMLSDPAPGTELAIPDDRSVRLGRSEDVDFPINHRSVSREHAELLRSGDAFTVRDLGSANGITVNGGASRAHTLRSGDIIELGQVVFRYVAPGEHYLFDPATAARYRTGLGGRSAQQLRLGALALGAVLVLGAVSFVLGGEEEPGETVTALQAEPGTAAPGAPATQLADDGYDKAVAACNAALKGARFAEALAHASMALKVRDSGAEARECKASAQAQYEEEQAYVRGKAALEAGDPETALQELSRLSATSAFRKRPEVSEVAEEVARARLARARALLPSKRGEAARLAQSVLALPRVSAASANAAEAIVAQAREEPSAAPAAAAPAPPARSGRSARPAAPAPREPQRFSPAPATGQSPMEIASACLARGDNECVVRVLAGRADTAQELGLLIETYRATGDTKQAQRSMAIYVKRFPTARRADAYRRMLELQGQ